MLGGADNPNGELLSYIIGADNVPWQEFANTVGGPFRQYAQNMAQIRFRIDTVQTAGVDQPVQQCTTLAAVIATEEHIIFLSETDYFTLTVQWQMFAVFSR